VNLRLASAAALSADVVKALNPRSPQARAIFDLAAEVVTNIPAVGRKAATVAVCPLFFEIYAVADRTWRKILATAALHFSLVFFVDCRA
jgi:hypothetical protein